ncbi:MAG: hypothetical protein ACRD26_10545, partial [Vicinamibacterales bacterium]
MPRVAIVTAGHLATCPRMLKAADALDEAGYDVRVISTAHTPWATAADRRLHARRRWRWTCVAYDRASAPVRWLRTGVRHRLAQAVPRGAASGRLAALAFSRVHTELVGAILGERQDFIYGGTSGALAAVAEASRRSGAPCALDFEDFHCGEHARDAPGSARDDLAAAIMADAVRQASVVTVGSAAIGRACRERFGISPVTINNVFPLPAAPGDGRRADPLRLYWFSQTIGPFRGLEDAVRAAGVAGIPAELHLRGAAIASYATELEALAGLEAPRLRLVWHGVGDPEYMVDACRGFDIGLAVEPGHTVNNALSLSNKALTYPLAGLALVLTDTPGQRALADDLGGQAIVYTPGRVAELAAGLLRWHEDRAALDR